jgi:hypothetical protein
MYRKRARLANGTRNRINAAKRDREAAVEKAEADKILAVKAAEAEAEAKHLSGNLWRCDGE